LFIALVAVLLLVVRECRGKNGKMETKTGVAAEEKA